MMPTADDFGAFYSAIHEGRQPFPWQDALARRIANEGRWPEAIDVPTGLGKTSVLDVAVFVAALCIAPARRRIFYVVDRRLVVDEAYEHAQLISKALADPAPNGLLAWVADRLRQPGDNTVLDVTRMRGGATWERTWLERPDRYAIVTGTVDQIGSRLLFRGYGVSDRARSIDAALVGTDSLIVVDEAHLAGPMLTTIGAALALDTPKVVPPPTVVTMSATSTAADESVHRITEADIRHEVAGTRLRAPKRIRLVEVSTTKRTSGHDVSHAIAHIAAGFAGTRVVGVVMNTIKRARDVFELLRGSHESILLTGASRQVDRDYLLARYYSRIRVGRDRDAQPLVVVATQTVEVGANIDFDVLVTETAPLPSLIQRLGRLNRIGHWSAQPAPAVVVHHSAVTADDPVYGPARLATFAWLSACVPTEPYTSRFDHLDLSRAVDGSPDALRHLANTATSGERAAMRPVERYTPVLFMSTLDTWARTSPAPVPDQPVAPFLHGVAEDKQPVTVVWRAGIEDGATRDRLLDVPPTAEEGLEVSITAARKWLLGRVATADEADIEAVFAQPDEGDVVNDRSSISKVVCIRRRDIDPEVVPLSAVRPGDLIVVPAGFGGCDEFGWNPTSPVPAMDVADLALRRGRPVLRLGHTLRVAIERVDGWQRANLTPLVERLLDQAAADAGAGPHAASGQVYAAILADMAAQEGLLPPLLAVIDALLERGPRVAITADLGDDGEPAAQLQNGGPLGLITTSATLLMDDDTAAGSAASVFGQVGLDLHERAVARRAREFANNLRLPERLVATVTFAARWHDEGKRDPRFQTLLWRGDQAAAEIAEDLLAKSGMDPADRAGFRDAARAAGYPRGMRHEALSARIAAVRPVSVDIDRQLAIHLVASHHGHARALLPPIHDPAPAKVEVPGLGVFESNHTVDWDQPGRFATLNDVHGRWGLALLEAIVRLADIWCSARNEIEDEEL